MTHPEKLNSLLYVLHWTHRKVLTNQPVSKKITFDWLCRTVAEVTEDWEVEYIKQRLLTDGYIKMGDFGDEEPPILTPAGIKYIQAGGYVQEAKDRDLDKITKLENLKNLKRSKTALWISILAFIIPTLISLYGILANKELPTKQQFQELQERIKKLESSKTETKTTSKALETMSFDTLKK